MPVTLREQLRGLKFSSIELARQSGWTAPLVEDYLSMVDNIIETASYIVL